MKHLRRCSSGDDICAWVLNYVRSVGATNVLAGVIPPPALSTAEQLSHVLLAAWPQEWSKRYFSGGYIYRDPTIRLVRQGTPAFMWSEIGSLCSPTLAEKALMSEATSFHLHQGFTVTLSTIERQRIGFSIAGERLEIDPYQRLTLELVSAYAIGSAIILTGGNEDRERHLSRRQLEVLHWASEGLTVEHIADRLGISCHTAEMHLRNVREKLGVASTLHAVAEAFRLGIIS
jgi:LuxR family quorum sensing-dependent transcriptional regulator